MRKLFVLFTAVFLSIGCRLAYAGDTAFATGDRGSGAYEVYVVTNEGLKVGNGTPSVTMDGEDAYIEGSLECASGILNCRDVFNDVPAPSNNGYFDSAISTTALVSATTTFAHTTLYPYPSTNVTAVCTFADGVSTTTVAGSLVITGYNARGVAVTEPLTISTNNATGTVALSRITSLAWTITSITGRSSTTNASLQVGPGQLLGLSNNIIASGDIISVIFDDSGTSTVDTTYTLNTTYDTIDTTTTGDGTTDVVTVVYTADTK